MLLVWHRRAGKDDLAMHMTAVAAHQRVGNYWHCLPMYEQARKAIWEAINPHSGKRRIDEAFPLELRKRTDNGSMTIELLCGSIWKLVGSDNPDSLVGAPPAGIVFSEWALANPSAWGYLAPILLENDGWAAFITTPRGRNHVKSMLDMARKKGSGWHAEVLTPDETGFPIERVEEQRKEYHAIFGKDAGDALIEQEYWCSFEAAILGAYYGREMLDCERGGRIADVQWDANLAVHTAWDLGVGDSTAIWFFQQQFGRIHVIDYYEADGMGASHYVEHLKAKPYTYGKHYLPHDARAREWLTTGPDGRAKTRIQILVEMGLDVQIVSDQKLGDGINAARRLIGSCWFDAEKCERGVECLRQYRREWDDDKKVFKDAPLHDWSSHGADAFRYMAVAIGELKPEAKAKPTEPQGIQDMTFDQLLKHHAKRRRERI